MPSAGRSTLPPQVLLDAAERGWKVERTKGDHWRARCPCGEHMVVTGSTPGDWRAIKNLAASIRRTGC